MPDVVRCFNDEGIAEFSRWLRNGAVGPVPASLLTDAAFSTPMEKSSIPEIPTFKDRYEFGLFLVDLLDPMIRIRFLTTRAYGVGWRPCFLSNSLLPMRLACTFR